MKTNVNWLGSVRIYIATVITANMIWEVTQLPLYTIWSTGTTRDILFAVVHCTAGDFIIATIALVAALLLFGRRAWPNERFIPVMIASLVIGVSYTIYSEWANAVLHKNWAYSNLMPKLPIIGTGLSPLLQWIMLPTVGFAAVSYFCRDYKQRR